MSLFDEAETSQAADAVEPDLNDVASYRRKRYAGQREEKLKNIPHEKKLCTLAEEDRFCEKCGTPLVSAGEEYVRTEIEFIPAKANGINPYKYIQFILSDIPGTAYLQYPEILDDYLPWNPMIQKICR